MLAPFSSRVPAVAPLPAVKVPDPVTELAIVSVPPYTDTVPLSTRPLVVVMVWLADAVKVEPELTVRVAKDGVSTSSVRVCAAVRVTVSPVAGAPFDQVAALQFWLLVPTQFVVFATSLSNRLSRVGLRASIH